MDGPLFIGSGECKDRSIFGENGMVTLADPGGVEGVAATPPIFFPGITVFCHARFPHGTYILDPLMKILDSPS